MRALTECCGGWSVYPVSGFVHGASARNRFSGSKPHFCRSLADTPVQRNGVIQSGGGQTAALPEFHGCIQARVEARVQARVQVRVQIDGPHFFQQAGTPTNRKPYDPEEGDDSRQTAKAAAAPGSLNLFESFVV